MPQDNIEFQTLLALATTGTASGPFQVLKLHFTIKHHFAET